MTKNPTTVVNFVSAHVFRFDATSQIRNVLARPRRTRGLERFSSRKQLAWAKIYGSGTQQSTGPGWEPRRWVVLTGWTHQPDCSTLSTLFNDVADFGSATSTESWAGLAIKAKGELNGTPVVISDQRDGHNGKVLAITSARVALRSTRDFNTISRETDASLQNAPGRIFSLGIGKWPVGQLATLSIWDSRSALDDWTRMTAHGQAIKAARRHGWFSEEFFGIFGVFDSNDQHP